MIIVKPNVSLETQMNHIMRSATRVGSLAVSIIVVCTLAAEAAPKRPSHAQQKCAELALQEYNKNVEDCEKRGLELGYSSGEQAQCVAMFAATLHRELEACGVASLVVNKSGLTGLRATSNLGDVDDDSNDNGRSSTHNAGASTSTGDHDEEPTDGGRNLGGTFNSSLGTALLGKGDGGGIIE